MEWFIYALTYTQFLFPVNSGSGVKNLISSFNVVDDTGLKEKKCKNKNQKAFVNSTLPEASDKNIADNVQAEEGKIIS